MARLTILQASQQGFGSTLTIHRHIKDGSLPIYEEGDVKLLEVDDLITLFGEPGAPDNDNMTSGDPTDVDVYEYQRMKSELDQKNKKTMWLEADLAAMARDFKEKEANFYIERDRLLKILEQAQALLLREAKRAGAGQPKSPDSTSTNSKQAISDMAGFAQDLAPAAPNLEPSQPPPLQAGNDVALDAPSPAPEMTMEEILAGKSKLPADDPQVDPLFIPPGNDFAEPSPDILTNSTGNAHKIVLDEDLRLKKELNTANPLIPPLKGENETPPKARLLGTATWILVGCLVGFGVIFLKFQPQIMSSIEEIGRVLGRG